MYYNIPRVEAPLLVIKIYIFFSLIYYHPNKDYLQCKTNLAIQYLKYFNELH